MSTGCLLLAAVLVASVAPTSEAYSLKVIDCTEPKSIRRYNKETVCKAEEPTEEIPLKERYTILQRPSTTKVQGFSCTERVSLYHFKCGVWGHLKLQQVPQTMRHEEVTAENCRRMSLLQQYQISGYGDPIKVKLNRPTYISASLAGSLKMQNDKITCVGQTIKMGDTIHTNTLKLAEYQILLKEETFLVSNDKVESETDHLSLPCPYHKGECMTGAATFVWNINDNACSLQMVNTINPSTTMDSYLVDHKRQVLLNTTGAIKLMHCPFSVLTTDHDGIYLGKTNDLSRLPMYTLNNLIPDLERRLDMWTKLKNWLNTYGDLMALLCLIILGIKFLTDLICVALTFLRVGPGAAIALIAHLYLYNKNAYQKLMRKKQAETREERRSPAPTAESTALLPTTPTSSLPMTEIRPIEISASSLAAYQSQHKPPKYQL